MIQWATSWVNPLTLCWCGACCTQEGLCGGRKINAVMKAGYSKIRWGSPIQGETTGAAGKRSRSVGLDDVRE